MKNPDKQYNPNWGGVRPGQGRPATGIKRVSISISGQPEEIAALKELARNAGKPVSRYVLDLALGK